MEENVPPRVIKHHQVRLPSQGGVANPSSPMPSVRCHEENGAIKSIEVLCPCGSKIVLDCEMVSEEKKVEAK